MSYNTGEFKGLNTPATDNEDDDCPPEFTTLAHEQEKCLLIFFLHLRFLIERKDFIFFSYCFLLKPNGVTQTTWTSFSIECTNITRTTACPHFYSTNCLIYFKSSSCPCSASSCTNVSTTKHFSKIKRSSTTK